MSSKPIIIGVGEYLWDVLPDCRKAGGAPVNFAFHAAFQGADSHVVTAVGADELGDELINIASDHGIDVLEQRSVLPTGTVNVTIVDGQPKYEINKDVAWDDIRLTEESRSLAMKCSAICFGSLAQRSDVSRSTIQQLCSIVPSDAYVVFDVNLRQDFWTRDVIVSSLDIADVLKLNEDELEIFRSLFGLQGLSEDQACFSLMKGWNLKMLILTAGASYSSVYYEGDVSRIDTPEVEVVDTVGAGDAFLGTFITALLQNVPVEKAHFLAVQRAATVCKSAGAWVK